MKNAGDPSLAGMKDKNGYTASDHAGMGKTSRYKYNYVFMGLEAKFHETSNCVWGMMGPRNNVGCFLCSDGLSYPYIFSGMQLCLTL